jgi:hypothetical protein
VPLPPALRSRLEPQMGFDLGGVRLHTDSDAASLASHLRAHAFTVGRHVFFAAGRFQPQTRAGLALMVHELTHVRQQPEGAPLRWGQLTVTQHRTLEQEADAQAQAVLAGETMAANGRRGEGVKRSAGRNDRIGELPGLIFAPRDGGGAFSPLVLSYASRTTAVLPLRQEATTATPETPTSAASPDSSGAPPQEPPDPEKLAQQVYEWIQRRLRIERERRGVQQWH